MSLLHEKLPEDFGSLDRSLFTLFRWIIGESNVGHDIIFINSNDTDDLETCLFVFTFSALRWMIPILNIRVMIQNFLTRDTPKYAATTSGINCRPFSNKESNRQTDSFNNQKVYFRPNERAG